MSILHPGRHLTGRFALTLPVALLLAGAAGACGGGDDDNEDADGTPTANPTIIMVDNAFQPKDITVPVNTDVTITVDNTGTAVHNMHVQSKEKEGQDFSSDALVNPGTTSTFTAKFAKTGKYDFVCDYHLPAMAGTIQVVNQ